MTLLQVVGYGEQCNDYNMMAEDASAARSARGARPLDLKARIRSQRSGEGKGGEFRGRVNFGWMPLSQEVRERRSSEQSPTRRYSSSSHPDCFSTSLRDPAVWHV